MCIRVTHNANGLKFFFNLVFIKKKRHTIAFKLNNNTSLSIPNINYGKKENFFFSFFVEIR